MPNDHKEGLSITGTLNGSQMVHLGDKQQGEVVSPVQSSLKPCCKGPEINAQAVHCVAL